ncbi:unnamed protein product, partial [Staurois parvus]
VSAGKIFAHFLSQRHQRKWEEISKCREIPSLPVRRTGARITAHDLTFAVIPHMWDDHCLRTCGARDGLTTHGAPGQ